MKDKFVLVMHGGRCAGKTEMREQILLAMSDDSVRIICGKLVVEITGEVRILSIRRIFRQ